MDIIGVNGGVVGIMMQFQQMHGIFKVIQESEEHEG
jgi:hypothetical protein